MPLWMRFVIFAEKPTTMQIVSAREFRSNQGKFLTAAMSGQSVMLTSRYGNFKITPVTDKDQIVESRVRASINEVKAHMEGRKELPDARDIVF